MISLVDTYNKLISEAFQSSDDIIKKIINQRRLASFYYMGDKENVAGWRTVECVAFGQGISKYLKSTKDKKYIRAWQLKGKTTSIQPGWKFFRTDRIKNWSIGTTTFNNPRPNFNPSGDKTMWKVFTVARFPSGGGQSTQNTSTPTPPSPTPTRKKPVPKPSVGKKKTVSQKPVPPQAVTKTTATRKPIKPKQIKKPQQVPTQANTNTDLTEPNYF